MPKFDDYRSLRKGTFELGQIGIPFNRNDDFDNILKVCTYLGKLYPRVKINIRPHPKDPQVYSSDLDNVYLSDPKGENSFEFLHRQDIIIGGNSSIHLEATLLNIPSIYFDFFPGTFVEDYYGFHKNGMIPKADNLEDLNEIIRHIPQEVQVYKRAAYYNFSVDKDWSSKEKAIQEIKAFL